MLPDGYVGLVVADTHRAMQWERGLRAAGFDVARVETTGSDVDKGDWQIAVPERERTEARAFVSRVLCGAQTLPARPMLSRTGYISLVLVGLVITALVVAGLAAR